MSQHKPPIVPTVLYIAEQHYSWKLAAYERLATKYHTPTTVMLAFGTIDGSVKRMVGKKGITKQQSGVYCLPDDAAWEKVQQVRARLQLAIDLFADELRLLGSYAKRLEQAGGIKRAPNPLSSTVIMVDDPDDDDHHYFVSNPIPRIDRREIARHTPKMLSSGPKDAYVFSQRDHFVCPDDAAWRVIQERQGAAQQAYEVWQTLLRELGTYQAALADGRYARKPAQSGPGEESMQPEMAPARVRPAHAVEETDLDDALISRLEFAGYRWQHAKQTPDGRWHHVISARNTALLRNDQVLMRRERLEALIAPASALAVVESTVAGVAMMDQAEARETIDHMRTDLGQVELSLSSFRQRAAEFADREGWRALGYGGAAEAINAELGTQYSKSYLSRLLKAAEIERILELPIGNSVPESQLRPLADLETPAQQRQAWQAATTATNGKPTAKAVEQAVEQIKPKPEQLPSHLTTCVRCGADRTQRHELTSYETGLVPEYPGRAVTLCNVCIPELLAARAKPNIPEVAPLIDHRGAQLGPGQPESAPWPDAPEGWRWNRKGAPAHLIAPDGWRTADYNYPERALAEAQRRILSQPKPAPAPFDPIAAARTYLAEQRERIRHFSPHAMVSLHDHQVALDQIEALLGLLGEAGPLPTMADILATVGAESTPADGPLDEVWRALRVIADWADEDVEETPPEAIQAKLAELGQVRRRLDDLADAPDIGDADYEALSAEIGELEQLLKLWLPQASEVST